MKAVFAGFLTLTTVVFGSGSAVADDARQVLPYCSLIANSANYVGKYVIVRGTFRFTQDGLVLFSKKCPKTRPTLVIGVRHGQAPTDAELAYQRLTSANPYTEANVTVDGRFKKAGLMECIAVTGGCYSYALEEAVLQSVLGTPE